MKKNYFFTSQDVFNKRTVNANKKQTKQISRLFGICLSFLMLIVFMQIVKANSTIAQSFNIQLDGNSLQINSLKNIQIYRHSSICYPNNKGSDIPSQKGKNFRGAELLAYQIKEDEVILKLQVYYSQLEHSVAETETVYLLSNASSKGSPIVLRKEQEFIDITPRNPSIEESLGPQADNKIVTYTCSIAIHDLKEHIDFAWYLNEDVGLLNNTSISENERIALQINLLKSKLELASNSSFLGPFPYLEIGETKIDSTVWRCSTHLQIENVCPVTISIKDEGIEITPITFYQNYTPNLPAACALSINGETKQVKVNQLMFGSYLAGFSFVENLEPSMRPHQAIFIIESKVE